MPAARKPAARSSNGAARADGSASPTPRSHRKAAASGAEPKRRSPPSLAAEIGKKDDFDSPEQEATLNLARTNAVLEGPFHELFKAHGLSPSAYNVLRILRGSGDDGRPATEIGPDMVVRVPDVTRLVDRLERDGYVERTRCSRDRRVVWVCITQAGLDLLKTLDPAVLDLHKAQLGHLTQKELSTLSRLLTKARHRGD